MFLPKLISVFRTVEYSTISILGYFKDTLPWTIWDSLKLEWTATRIENKTVIWIKLENVTRIKSEKVSQKQLEKTSQIQSKTATSVELPMPMMALASDTWHVNGQALGATEQCLWWYWHLRALGRRHRRRLSVSVKRSGFYITGPWSGSLGESLVPADWRLRVFGMSVLVYRPSDHL